MRNEIFIQIRIETTLALKCVIIFIDRKRSASYYYLPNEVLHIFDTFSRQNEPSYSDVEGIVDVAQADKNT